LVVDILYNLLREYRGVLILVVDAIVIVSAIQAWARTRSIGPAIGAVILGAAVLWALGSMAFLQSEIAEDINKANQPGGFGGNGTQENTTSSTQPLACGSAGAPGCTPRVVLP
jgi:hypothetical protein